MSRTVMYVVGARPNFMKMAPLLGAVEAAMPGDRHLLVHTGQHYDRVLNDDIFRDLGLRAPDVHLGVGSGSHAEQTARIMVAFEQAILQHHPELVVVAGDVNSTLACSICAAKAIVPVAHVEAGLRSYDWTMPEEINRLVTDRLSSLFLTPSADADANLAREGVPASAVVRVGNLMIDTLQRSLPRARSGNSLARLGLAPKSYVLATLHRPSNVDDPERFGRLLALLDSLAQHLPVVFPVHPRTKERLGKASLSPGVIMLDAMAYLDFLQLEDGASVVLTDSGGVQEETTALGVPCVTLRTTTERPATVTHGTNVLSGESLEDALQVTQDILGGRRQVPRRIPELWDGMAATRAAVAIAAFLDAPFFPSHWAGPA